MPRGPGLDALPCSVRNLRPAASTTSWCGGPPAGPSSRVTRTGPNPVARLGRLAQPGALTTYARAPSRITPISGVQGDHVGYRHGDPRLRSAAMGIAQRRSTARLISRSSSGQRWASSTDNGLSRRRKDSGSRRTAWSWANSSRLTYPRSRRDGSCWRGVLLPVCRRLVRRQPAWRPGPR